MNDNPFLNNKNLKLHQKVETIEVSQQHKLTISHAKTKGIDNIPQSMTTALIYNSNDPSDDPTQSHRNGHGGARLKKDRENRFIATTQVLNVIAAADFAIQIGRPFNREICISWMLAGIELDLAVHALGRFIDLLSKMIRSHGEATAWVYSFEVGKISGKHCHILIHIPHTLRKRILSAQRRWLTSITGRKYRKRSIKSRPIGLRLELEHNNFPLYLANLIGRICYILKGAEADASNILGQRALIFQGVTIGKRCGTSQNIGKAARNKANAERLFL